MIFTGKRKQNRVQVNILNNPKTFTGKTIHTIRVYKACHALWCMIIDERL